MFTIYGGTLRRGYCEVHPDYPEEYPCYLCLEEARQRQYERDACRAMECEAEHQWWIEEYCEWWSLFELIEISILTGGV